MNSLFALNSPTSCHLHEVMQKMRRMGPPRIRAVWREFRGRKGWYAIEGSHRTAAASRLALTPISVHVKPGTRISRHDVYGVDSPCTAADLLRVIDEEWRDRSETWLEYRFPKLRGPRSL